MSKRSWIALVLAVAFLVAAVVGISLARYPADTRTSQAEPSEDSELAAASASDMDWIDARDFGALQHGARLPGSDEEFPVVSGATTLATLRAYVTCSPGAATCDVAPDGEEIYTYVLTVTPRGRVSSFQTVRAIPGFNGVAGFDAAQARDAIGAGSEMVLQCADGALIWAINGGDLWRPDAPVTLFWQSTTPPERDAGAFQLVSEGSIAEGTGPFPAEGGSTGCG